MIATITRAHREAAVRACFDSPPNKWGAATLNFVENRETWAPAEFERALRVAQAIADAEASAKPRWILCSERMPEQGAIVVAMCDEGSLWLMMREGDTWRLMESGPSVTGNLVKWCELPEDE